MKGKKGLDFIDWSISMGIFIIAVTALFVFLSPGSRPNYDQDTLLSMVEKQVVERAQWFVHETPLYVKKFQDKGSSGSQATIEVKSLGDAKISAVKPSSDPRYEPVQKSAARLMFDCRYTCDGTNFTIISITKGPQETRDMDVRCTPSSEPSSCTALLGATITHHGLQQSEINVLADPQQTSYETLKQSWTYPLQREFALYQRDPATGQEKKIVGGQEPAQQANIAVKEIKMNLINDQGIQAPTIINIRVW